MKKNNSLNELYKHSKNSHPSITKKIVKEWADKQQAIQMNNPVKVGSNNYLPIYYDVEYAFQIDLTFFPR